jgi:hypothetical protein
MLRVNPERARAAALVIIDEIRSNRRKIRCLEIGALNKPFLKKVLADEYVEYADHVSTEELARKYMLSGESLQNLVHVDHVIRGGQFTGTLEHKYDLVFSSHSLEHQPDLLGHLHDIHGILKPGGYYLCIVPDCRYVFDNLRPPSSIVDVLVAHHNRPRKPSTLSVLEHYLFNRSASSDSKANRRSWLTDTLQERALRSASSVCGAAIENRDQLFKLLNSDQYQDCHVWKFFPELLELTINALHEIGLIPYSQWQIQDCSNEMYMYEFGLFLKS